MDLALVDHVRAAEIGVEKNDQSDHANDNKRGPPVLFPLDLPDYPEDRMGGKDQQKRHEHNAVPGAYKEYDDRKRIGSQKKDGQQSAFIFSPDRTNDPPYRRRQDCPIVQNRDAEQERKLLETLDTLIVGQLE